MSGFPVPRFRALFLSALFLSLLAGRAVADTQPVADSQPVAPQINIRVEMTAEPSVVEIGGDVTFVYTVINTGDVALTDVTVVDRDNGPIATVAQLDPGESKSWTRQETVDDSSKTRRAVIVDATGPDGQPVHAQRDVSFTIVPASTTTTSSTTTTTTAPPTTTTTAAPPTTTTTIPTQVLGVQISRPAPELPRTGSSTAGRVLAGLVLIVAGMALRRRTRVARA